ncbi:hypothetical protein D3C81_366990 [compost metagenome]
MDNVTAHLCQHRLQGGEQCIAGANHEGQRACRGTTGTTGNRCIGQVHALLGGRRRHFTRGLRINGAAVDHRRTGTYAGQHAVLAQVHAAYMSSGWQHGNHQLTLLRGITRRCADLPTELGKLGEYSLVQIEQIQLMAGLNQVARHWCAHVAQANKCDTHNELLSAG